VPILLLLLQKTPKKSNCDSCVDEILTTEAKYVQTLDMLIKASCYIASVLRVMFLLYPRVYQRFYRRSELMNINVLE